ncbi:PH domain-like protein [Wolfiporia cocos MD-104 SS10]|uniref:PH domain-like protein n=1 Tax=Wolfiporia cocos (strain MD-104) TaxID=742152 RepID=A0A2H3JMJ6_WOLCO|nr:PH domain-like protein [Wolfiporia cocos MD-104 SS10]
MDAPQTGESAAEGAEGEVQPPPLSTSVFDSEGKGEEDEETTHEIKSKVFKMFKKDGGQLEWRDQGVGMLRLKQRRETNARRVLMRNSTTGKIILNFSMYPGMKPTLAGKVVSFVGFDNGTSTSYKVRTKTDDQAKELQGALEREIEFVRAKSESP